MKQKPRLTSVVMESLLAVRNAAFANVGEEMRQNFVRGNEWLTEMSAYKRIPRQKSRRRRKR
jgi:hypothetical protein